MANENLTVRQAQYILERMKAEYLAKSGGTLTNGIVTGSLTASTSTLSFGDDASRVSWLSALGMGNDPVEVTDTVSVATATDTTICLTAQYDAGVYIVSAYASFAANSSGRRHMHISTTNTGSAVDDWSQLTLAPSNAQPTVMQVTTIQKRTSTGRWYLRVYQNSGSAKSVTGGIKVLKLY